MKSVAQLIADSVSVICPKCGGCQPNPDDGSDLWMPEDFRKNTLDKCVSCDEPLLISHHGKVQFDQPSGKRKRSR